MMRNILAAMVAVAVLAAPAAADMVVNIDGTTAVAATICFEEIERDGLPVVPVCYDAADDFDLPVYPARVYVFAEARPEKITPETAVYALQVVAGIRGETKEDTDGQQ